MSLKKLALKIAPEHKGKRLDQVLAEWLPQALGKPVSKAKARKLIVAGAVYLNGKRVRIASKELQLGARVEAFVDPARLFSDEPSRGDQPFELKAEHVLFEDEHLIAVDKPPGLPTQPTLDEARDNLFAAVKKFLARRDGGQPYVGLHHRLDRDTSGVVLFTKQPAANAGVADLFAKHKAVKTYNALTVKPAKLPPAQWTVKNFLAKGAPAPGRGKQARFRSVRSGGDPAHTDFRLIEAFPRALWIEAKPRTGRTHQIRVHLSEDGMPILADGLYGGPPGQAPRLMLHAVNLTFPHPITNVETSVSSPIPKDFLHCLDLLKRSEASPAGSGS